MLRKHFSWLWRYSHLFGFNVAQPAYTWTWRGRIGILLLALWILLQSLLALHVPLGDISGWVGILGLITALLLLAGI